MKLKPARISVFPNPWGVHPRCVIEPKKFPVESATVDASGRFCGNISKDFGVEGFNHDSPFVGSYADGVLREKVGDIRGHRQDTGYRYLGVSNRETEPHQLAKELSTKDPLSLRYSDYYEQAIATGQLIAADEKTAKVCGVPFEKAETLFAKLSEAAAKFFNDTTYDGEDAYRHFIDERQPSPEDEVLTADPVAPSPIGDRVRGIPEKGGAPLSLGEKVGDFLPPKGDETALQKR